MKKIKDINAIMQDDTYNSIWNILGANKVLIDFCIFYPYPNFFLEYHPVFNLTVLQWLLWFVARGVKTYSIIKEGNYSKKDWAFNKISILHKFLPPDIWKALVNMPAGFNNKCKTIHFFTRNTHHIDKEYLSKIIEWLDEANGRKPFYQTPDEYGYTPAEYIYFHKKRNQLFVSKYKKIVDPLVNKYHELEGEIMLMLNFSNMFQYYEWLKLVSEQDILIQNDDLINKAWEIARLRIESHYLHNNVFDDELANVEKKEENLKRGLTLISNHLWMIKAYKCILKGTIKEKLFNNLLESKNLELIYNFFMIPQIKCPLFSKFNWN